MDQIIFRNIQTILPLPGNAKDHDIPGIQQSMRDFGFADPIGVNPRNNFDLDGNGRLEALLLMHAAGEPCPRNIREEIAHDDGQEVRIWYVPTVNLDYDEPTQDLLAVRLNQANLSKGFDNEKLVAILDRAKEQGRLAETGFDVTGHYTVRTLVENARKQAELGHKNDQPPGNFPTVDPATINVDYVCPNCQYGWSGKPKPTGADGIGANIQPTPQETRDEQQQATLPDQRVDDGANQQ